MAKPDCDDGWVKVSAELMAALDYADFSKLARTVLRYVFFQVFGPAKAKYAVIHQSKIAERTGQCRQNVCRAVRELVDSMALAPAGEDRYRFLKCYPRWVHADGRGRGTGKPRLTPAEVKDCREAARLLWSFAEPEAPADVIPLDYMQSPDVIPLDYEDGTVSASSNGITNGNPTGLHPPENGNPTGLQTVIQRDYTPPISKIKEETESPKETKSPIDPSTCGGDPPSWITSPDFAALLAQADLSFPSRPDSPGPSLADAIRSQARDIHSSLKGQYDFLAGAIRAAEVEARKRLAVGQPPIENLVPYCLSIARRAIPNRVVPGPAQSIPAAPAPAIGREEYVAGKSGDYYDDRRRRIMESRT